MRAVTRRVASLENQIWSPSRPRERFRFVVGRRDGRHCLEHSTCKRTLCSNGTLMEMIRFGRCDCRSHDLTEEQLEAWVESFPVETLAN